MAQEVISERVFRLSQLVANIAANALENGILFDSIKSAQEYFEEVSLRDDLTKLYNRRHFYNRLKEEFSRSIRYGDPLSLLFIDVDDFKRINDTYGHAAGDKVLQEIGRLLKDVVRKGDIPARCGGDEFAMLLPNTNSDGAYSWQPAWIIDSEPHYNSGIRFLNCYTAENQRTHFGLHPTGIKHD